MLAEPPLGADPPRLRQIIAAAAQDLGTLALLPRESITDDLLDAAASLVPHIPRDNRTWTTRSCPRCGPWNSRTTPGSSARWRP